MTRPFDKHLDSDELDGLVSSLAAGVTDSRRLSEQVLGEARRHVESCQDCSRKVQVHKSVQSEIWSMGVLSNVPSGPDCVAEAEWLNVAAGLLPESKTRELMKHAAQCGHCGPLLRNAAEALGDETTPSEEVFLASLPSASQEWHKNMAETLRRGSAARGLGQAQNEKRESVAGWQGLFALPRPAFALAGIAAVVMAGWLGWRALHPPSTDQLLAQAYSDHRTMEVRIPGAKYAPIRAERGAVGSSLDKPPALLKAEALIGENLRKHPNDPAWLQSKARADLLDGNYESAIKSLQHALEEEPDSPSLLTDLGSGYFQRAEASDHPIDYGNAIESLGKALAKSPDDPIALFNRALACDRMFLYTQEVDDWERYLRIDSQGEWADDARQRLAAVKEKIKQHEKSENEPLLTPTQIAAGLSSHPDQTLSHIDKRVEQYLDEAIKSWLPRAFPTNDGSPTIRVALEGLSELLAERHHDTWLNDLLQTAPSFKVPTGLQRLADAAQATSQGDPDTALRNALVAEVWFRKTGGLAGALRAELEEIYAFHRRYQLNDCLSAVAKMRSDLRNSTYPWIKTQVDLEQYACLSTEEAQRESANQLIANAREKAISANYGTLYLRTLAFSASSETESGSVAKAWNWDHKGLGRYWSGNYPPLRAQHFYDDLTISAQDSQRWYLAVALGREAVAAIVATPNRTGEGMERIRLATSASHAHLWQEADRQYSQALKAFASLPANLSTRAFRAAAEIGLGDLALSQKHVNQAESHLTYARANLPLDFQDGQTWLALYNASAELQLQSGNPEGARKSCIAAVLVAEVSLRGVHSEIERLRWRKTGTNCYKKLVGSMLDDHDETHALELWERYQAAGTGVPQIGNSSISHFANLDGSPILPTTSDVTAQISSLNRETVIAYIELDDGVGAWVYDDRGIFWHPLNVDRASLKSTLAKFESDCSDAGSDITELRRNGRQLYDSLVAPLATHLDPSRTLVIEADGAISAVPFAALVDPSGAYLVDRFAITYLPAIGYRKILRQNVPITRNDNALVVGAPALSATDQSLYPPLPDASREADTVANAFARSLRLQGSQATTTAVVNALPAATVFHFAGHTQAQPGRSGLLLAPERDVADGPSSVLTSDDLGSSHLPSLRLVVLSACSTSRDASDTTESGSLPRSFLKAGVPSVVATRWQVDSAATADFMQNFYGAVLSGKEVSAAVASAMEQTRALERYSHPYYWAAFEMFGRGSRLN